MRSSVVLTARGTIWPKLDLVAEMGASGFENRLGNLVMGSFIPQIEHIYELPYGIPLSTSANHSFQICC